MGDEQEIIDREYKILLERVPELKGIGHKHPVFDPGLMKNYGIANVETDRIRIGPPALKDPDMLPGTIFEEMLHLKYSKDRYHHHGKITKEVSDKLREAGYPENVWKKGRYHGFPPGDKLKVKYHKE